MSAAVSQDKPQRRAKKTDQPKRGWQAATPMSASQIRELATVYLQDLADRLGAVAKAMDEAQPPIATVGVMQYGTATKGLEQMIELVLSAEMQLKRLQTPSVRDRLACLGSDGVS